MLPNVNPTFSRQAEQQGQNFPQIEWPASAVSHPSCSLGSDLDKARDSSAPYEGSGVCVESREYSLVMFGRALHHTMSYSKARAGPGSPGAAGRTENVARGPHTAQAQPARPSHIVQHLTVSQVSATFITILSRYGNNFLLETNSDRWLSSVCSSLVLYN